MTKLNPARTIQKLRTEEEMRSALTAFQHGTPERSIPPQVDDTAIVLADIIEELLDLRAMREEVRAFIQCQSARLARK